MNHKNCSIISVALSLVFATLAHFVDANIFRAGTPQNLVKSSAHVPGAGKAHEFWGRSKSRAYRWCPWGADGGIKDAKVLGGPSHFSRHDVKSTS
jgi:hypothetical protein